MNEMTSTKSQVKMQKIPPAARLFFKMLQNLKVGHLQIITPGHEHVLFGDTHQPPSASLQIHDWRACGRILRAGDIGFAESVEAGWLDTPDMTALLRLAIRNENALDRALFGGKLSSLWYRIKHWLRPNTRSGSSRNIFAHYDIGNDFYQLWLDPSWTYSSAMFDGNYSMPLQQAQSRKYQRIIDVLELKTGDSVLEIGCGWGGFAEHAALLGIQVHGVTISPSQLAVAQQRIKQAQLDHLVKLEICDYRDMSGTYDAIVSIEMFEAVGEKFWPGYFSAVHQRLKAGGRALVQTITIEESRFERYRSSTDFIQQYIFPGGMLPSPERFCHQAEKQGFQVQDQYAFGKDYAETLRRWNGAFEEQRDHISTQGFGTAFQRIWQLYFTYCEAGFDEGSTDVIQFTLKKNA